VIRNLSINGHHVYSHNPEVPATINTWQYSSTVGGLGKNLWLNNAVKSAQLPAPSWKQVAIEVCPWRSTQPTISFLSGLS